MLTFVVFVLSFVASTLAYEITSPNNSSGWTDQGSQTVFYDKVNTDQPFTVYLVDQKMNISEQLDAQVTPNVTSGNNITLTVNPPSGGWVDDVNYRVRFMSIPDPNNNNSTGILAESDTFTIAPSSTTASGTSSGFTISVPTTTTPGTETTGTSDSSASDSANILPTSSSAAALSYPVQTGLLGLFTLLGFALA